MDNNKNVLHRGIPKDKFIDILNKYHGDKPVMFEDMMYLFFIFGNEYDNNGNLVKDNLAKNVKEIINEGDKSES